MATVTIGRTEPVSIEFEVERLETRYPQPRSDVDCGSCEFDVGCVCSSCAHVGCSGCEGCHAALGQ